MPSTTQLSNNGSGADQQVYGFSGSDVQRIKNAVQANEAGQTPGLVSSARRSSSLPVVVATITGGTNPYYWTQQRPTTGGTLSAMPNGTNGGGTSNEAYEINKCTSVPSGINVVLNQSVVIDATSSQPRMAWTFSYVPPTPLIVKVTSNGSGGGVYNGTAYAPNSSTVAISSSSISVPGSLTNDGTCVIFNLPETGSSAHILPANTFHNGILIGYTSGPLPVVTVESVGNGTADYQVLQRTSGGTLLWDYVRAH